MMKFLKQPSESWPIACEFAGKLPSGSSLVSGTVTAVRLDTGATDLSVLASTTITISGTRAVATVQGGTDGVDYKITFLVSLSAGGPLEEDIQMEVRNL